MEDEIIELFELIVPDQYLRVTDSIAYHEVKENKSRGRYLMLASTVVFHEVQGWYVIIRTGEFRLIKLLNENDIADVVIMDWQCIPCTEEGFFQHSLLQDLEPFTPDGLAKIKRLYNRLVEILYD